MAPAEASERRAEHLNPVAILSPPIQPMLARLQRREPGALVFGPMEVLERANRHGDLFAPLLRG